MARGWRMLALAALLGGQAACQSRPGAQSPTAVDTVMAPSVTAPPETPSPMVSATATRELPTLTPGPTPCSAGTGQVEETGYASPLTGERLPLRVYLPPCYGEGEARYPVVVLLHGYPFDETHWSQIGVEAVLEAGIGEGRWSPMLLVMPRAPDALFVGTDGGPGSYEQEVVEGLLPYVEGEYRALPGAYYRALAGISRGGVWALEIGLRNPQVFSRIGALSPALHVNRARPAYDPYWLAENGDRFPQIIFLSAGQGERDFLDATLELYRALQRVESQVTMLEVEGGHDGANWAQVLPDLLGKLSAGWSGAQDTPGS